MQNRMVGWAQSAWVIAIVALILRLAYVAYMAHLIPSAVLATVSFQDEVGNVAAALASGKGFCCLFREATGPTAWLSPIYPLILAAIFKIVGTFTLPAFCCAVILNCVFSALATVPLFRVTQRICGVPAAAFAGWIWAFFPSGIILPFEWIWDTSLSVLFAAALLWGTAKLRNSDNYWDFARYGLLWGLSLLTNPALGAVLPFLVGWLWYQRSHSARASRLLLTTIGVVILACLPWTARNYIQFHRIIPLRSNFPFEFWSGNNEIFDERSHQVNRITRYEQTHLYGELGETEFLNRKMHEALQFVGSNPALYAKLFGQRIIATWIGTDSPFHDFAQTDSPLARFLILWNAISCCGAIAGLVKLYKYRRVYFVLIAAFPLVFPLTFYIAHTTLRHRHPCDPVVALLMAVACIRIKGTDRDEIV